jgi:glutathione S-transferase
MEMAQRDFEIIKHVDAPIDDVFRAFTDADALAAWWGPEGFNVTDVTSDARPGGEFRLVMAGPDGVGQPVAGRYQEVSPPSHLVAEISAGAPDGSTLVTAVLTFHLAPVNAGTEIRLSAHGTAFTSEARGMLDGMQEGWTSSLICLERFLEESHGSTLKARHETA